MQPGFNLIAAVPAALGATAAACLKAGCTTAVCNQVSTWLLLFGLRAAQQLQPA
jgi:hypothetical protein